MNSSQVDSTSRASLIVVTLRDVGKSEGGRAMAPTSSWSLAAFVILLASSRAQGEGGMR